MRVTKGLAPWTLPQHMHGVAACLCIWLNCTCGNRLEDKWQIGQVGSLPELIKSSTVKHRTKKEKGQTSTHTHAHTHSQCCMCPFSFLVLCSARRKHHTWICTYLPGVSHAVHSAHVPGLGRQHAMCSSLDFRWTSDLTTAAIHCVKFTNQAQYGASTKGS